MPKSWQSFGDTCLTTERLLCSPFPFLALLLRCRWRGRQVQANIPSLTRRWHAAKQNSQVFPPSGSAFHCGASFSNPNLGLFCWSWERSFSPLLDIQRCLVRLCRISTRLPETSGCLHKSSPKGWKGQRERVGLSVAHFEGSFLSFCSTSS